MGGDTTDKDTTDKIDAIADGLDDLKTTVDEVETSPAAESLDGDALKKLKNALDGASDAADELENKTE